MKRPGDVFTRDNIGLPGAEAGLFKAITGTQTREGGDSRPARAPPLTCGSSMSDEAGLFKAARAPGARKGGYSRPARQLRLRAAPLVADPNDPQDDESLKLGICALRPDDTQKV